MNKLVENNKNNASIGLQVLDNIYDYALKGLPVKKSVEELGDEYLDRYKDPKIAARKFINNQVAKCTTSGFLTNIGGLITLPIAIPINITSVLYVQMRMIATLAYIGGLNPRNDEVQTMCYIALTGKGASDLLKQMGIKFGDKIAKNMLAKVSGTTLTKINQKIGFRFITKAGEKGIVNLGKGLPIVGGFIGGLFDFATTKIIAKTATIMFIE